MTMQDYRKLLVFQRAHQLVLDIYSASRGFPKEELYGLTSQLRRAMMSVPLNIAEGCGRSTAPDRARFFNMAMGSACEAEYCLTLARDLGYLSDETHIDLSQRLEEFKRMHSALLRRMSGKAQAG